MKLEINPTPEQWRLLIIALLLLAGVGHNELLMVVGL